MALPKRIVEVSLEIATDGPIFCFTPKALDVKFKERVVWRRAEDSPEQFEFAALVFNRRNPFEDVVVHKLPKDPKNPNDPDLSFITAMDNYQVVDEHDYNVLVKVVENGVSTYYDSAESRRCIGTDTGNPTIRNK